MIVFMIHGDHNWNRFHAQKQTVTAEKKKRATERRSQEHNGSNNLCWQIFVFIYQTFMISAQSELIARLSKQWINHFRIWPSKWVPFYHFYTNYLSFIFIDSSRAIRSHFFNCVNTLGNPFLIFKNRFLLCWPFVREFQNLSCILRSFLIPH